MHCLGMQVEESQVVEAALLDGVTASKGCPCVNWFEPSPLQRRRSSLGRRPGRSHLPRNANSGREWRSRVPGTSRRHDPHPIVPVQSAGLSSACR